MRGDSWGKRQIMVPAGYQSDEQPHIRLTKLETDYVGASRSGFDWKKDALVAPQSEQLEVRLTLRGNAEAVRRLAAFFGLYGQDAEFRARGFLPTSPAVMALPPASDEIGEVVEAPVVDGLGDRRDDVPVDENGKPLCTRCRRPAAEFTVDGFDSKYICTDWPNCKAEDDGDE